MKCQVCGHKVKGAMPTWAVAMVFVFWGIVFGVVLAWVAQ